MGNYIRKTATCPCCRRRLQEKKYYPKRLPLMGAVQQRILDTVVPNGAGMETIIMAVYSGTKNDGPEDPATSIRVHITHINKKLLSWPLPKKIKSSGRMYQLVDA